MKPATEGKTLAEQIVWLKALAEDCICPETEQAILSVLAHVDELREGQTRLHRRCQVAEAAAQAKMARPEYRSFGRALLVYGFQHATAHVAALEAALEHIRALAMAGGHVMSEAESLSAIATHARMAGLPAAGAPALTPPAGGQECDAL